MDLIHLYSSFTVPMSTSTKAGKNAKYPWNMVNIFVKNLMFLHMFRNLCKNIHILMINFPSKLQIFPSKSNISQEWDSQIPNLFMHENYRLPATWRHGRGKVFTYLIVIGLGVRPDSQSLPIIEITLHGSSIVYSLTIYYFNIILLFRSGLLSPGSDFQRGLTPNDLPSQLLSWLEPQLLFRRHFHPHNVSVSVVSKKKKTNVCTCKRFLNVTCICLLLLLKPGP